ncbi:archaellin/type IV pilin N-terminal domain-containing protein [Methanococcoides methylutens]|uniref:Flagellin n=1 Tax=Methanococcoides methylutens MM1 TaxID=1434104 RepID=A0A0E3SQ87_METMT|nr:archaellin/type IV pilin N-terminal domain-containing protein [Methanococcoides methylutens]AKB84761.1 Flagellin FlaB2 [Methanococcoides methylutens MM1]
MKANNKHLMKKDERAQVGIGTLIIFIAMVLVAAVAAAVLIQTSGVLQERASSTGQQAAQEVSSNMMVKSIEGVRSADSDADLSESVDLLKLKVALNIGSSDIDLNQVVITVTDGVATNDLVYAGNDKTYGVPMAGFNSSATSAENMVELLTNNTAAAGDNGQYFFVVEKVRDEDESFSQESPIMNQGDLVTIYISSVSSTSAADAATLDGQSVTTPNSTGLTVEPRSEISILMTPEAGSSTTATFTAPSFGVDTNIGLYP